MSFGQLQSSFPVPATMGEDSMEISSDNGHNLAGEDIDIDIDLTGGPVDEDYVLEDAQSDIGFDDSFDLHGNDQPQVGDDDLMADDDHHSFSMNDIDADVDEVVHDVHEVVDDTEEMVTSNVSNNDWDRIQQVDQDLTTQDDPDMSGDQQILSEDVVQVGLPTALTSDQKSPAAVASEENKELVAVSEESAQVGLTEPGSPDNEAPLLEQTTEETNSVPEAEEQKPKDPTEVVDDLESAAGHVELPIDGNIKSPAERKITVMYQDTEYELFSSSDADNPDLFFLNDRSMIYEPLPTFLAALKDVIHDEVSAEDELCLSFDNLGVELSETSLNISQLTFSEVVGLYDHLLRNDGVASPGPVHVTIGLRPDFARKVASLRISANDGKGLSELVSTWDEGSDSFDEESQFNQIEENEIQEDGYYEDGVDPSEIAGADSEEQNQDRLDTESSNDAQTNPEATVEVSHEETTKEVGKVDGENTHSDHIPVLDAQTVKQEYTSQGSTAVKPAVVNETQDTVHEEGDFLDYSDNEDEDDDRSVPTKTRGTSPKRQNEEADNGTSPNFIEPCYKPSVCFCPECNKLLIAEYHAKEEELRRRSISRLSEEEELQINTEVPETSQALGEQPDAQSDAQAIDQEGHDHYDQHDQPDDEANDVAQESNEDFTTEDQTTVETLTQDDEFDNTTLAEHGEDTIYYEQRDEQGEEQEDGNTDENHNSTDTGDGTELSNAEPASEIVDESTETNVSFQEAMPGDLDTHLGEEDQSSGSVTVAGDTQAADEIDYYDDAFDMAAPTGLEGIIEEQAMSLQKAEDIRDEIDYDDEEPQDNDQTDTAQDPQSPSSIGKRRRSDTDYHDDTEGESQDAKRKRS